MGECSKRAGGEVGVGVEVQSAVQRAEYTMNSAAAEPAGEADSYSFLREGYMYVCGESENKIEQK